MQLLKLLFIHGIDHIGVLLLRQAHESGLSLTSDSHSLVNLCEVLQGPDVLKVSLIQTHEFLGLSERRLLLS